MATYKLQIIVEGQDKASGPLGRVGGSLQRIGEIAGGVVAAGLLDKVAGGLASLASSAFDFGKEAVLSAARVQEMGAVISVLAKNNDIAQETVDSLIESIKDQGITTQVAQELTAKFIQYQLDMGDATDLARVAQDAAVISMSDSSEALAGLMHGITTMNTRVLRTYGITLASTIDAQDLYAESLGLTRDQLTITQKQQAVLNAVIAAGTRIEGAYEAAMNTAGKQLRSMKRHVVELLNNVGAPFLDAFAEGVGGITNFIKGLKEGTTEGGMLLPIIETLSGSLKGLGDVFVPILNYIGAILSDGDDMNDWLTHLPESIRPIVEVMGGVLATALENLPGFIDNVSGAFKKFIEPIMAVVGAIFHFIKHGEVLDDFFVNLPDGIRPFAEKITEIAAILIDEVPKAIETAVEWFDEHLKPVIEEVAGLVGDIIDIFLEWIGMTVDDLTPGLEDASGGIMDFVEGALTQFRDILIEVRDWVATHGETLKNFFTGLAIALGVLAGAAAIGAVISGIGSLVALLGTLLSPVGLIVAAIALLVLAWKEDFGGIRTTLTEFWEKAEPILKQVAEWIGEKIGLAIEGLSTIWEEVLKPMWDAFVEFAEDHLVPLFEAIGEVLEVTVGLALTALAGLWENVLQPAFETVVDFIKEKLQPALEDNLGGPLTWLKEHVVQPFIDALGGIGDVIDDVVGWLGDLATTIGGIELPDWLTPGSATPFEVGLLGIADALRKVNDLSPTLGFEGVAAPAVAGGGVGLGGDTHINVDVRIDSIGSQEDADFFIRRIVEEIRQRMRK